MPYLEKYNSDDIHARSVIAGLLSFLNQEIFILNTWDNSDSGQEIVEVPFYYSITGDERYLQDFFSHTWNKCLKAGLEGNFDALPRGMVKLESTNIDTASMTQRWIRGNFNRVIKNVDKDGNVVSENIEAFNAYINSIPQRMDFSVEMHTDTLTDAFKLQQTITEVFYKSQVFYTTYKGILVPCQVNFPEQYGIEKTFEMTYPSDNTIKLAFNLDVETYLPVIDEPNLGSNNAIQNVNKMNDWVENKPTNSNDTYEAGIEYAKRIEGNENAYYVGISRRDMVKVRLGHNSVTTNGCPDRNDRYVEENRSYELGSIRKNSNRMEKIVFGNFGDLTELKKNINLSVSRAGDSIRFDWTLTGYVDKVDIYMAKKDKQGNDILIKRIAKYIEASKMSYECPIDPLMYTKAAPVPIAVNSSDANGNGANVFGIIDGGGSLIDVIVTDGGSNYDDGTTVEVEFDGEVYTPAEIIPSIIGGQVTKCTIRNKGNYDIDGVEMSDGDNVTFFLVSTAGNVKSNEAELAQN